MLAKNVPHPVMKSKNYGELLFEENKFLFDKRISKKAIGNSKESNNETTMIQETCVLLVAGDIDSGPKAKFKTISWPPFVVILP